MNAKALEHALKAQGSRMTLGRQMVIREIAGLTGHISATELCRRLANMHPSIDPSTVYRALETFCQAGLLRRTHVQDGVTLYHHVDVEPHQHLVCRSCGDETELCQEDLNDIAEEIRKRYHFVADITSLAVSGRCESCNSATSEERNAPPQREQRAAPSKRLHIHSQHTHVHPHP